MATETSKSPSKMKFSQMSVGGKLVFFGKLIVFFVTLGFAFPNLLAD